MLLSGCSFPLFFGCFVYLNKLLFVYTDFRFYLMLMSCFLFMLMSCSLFVLMSCCLFMLVSCNLYTPMSSFFILRMSSCFFCFFFVFFRLLQLDICSFEPTHVQNFTFSFVHEPPKGKSENYTKLVFNFCWSLLLKSWNAYKYAFFVCYLVWRFFFLNEKLSALT